MSSLQEEFDKGIGNYAFAPGEYEGPLVVRRPCEIDGKNTTLWASSGPVLVIDSPGVSVKGLRVELVDPGATLQNRVAISNTYADTKLFDVEVNGNVEGIQGEDSSWALPTIIALGEFAAEKENCFSYAIEAPCAAELICKIKDVKIAPAKLAPGRNVLEITTASMRDNSILYGEILVKTQVIRRIYILGTAKKGAPEHKPVPPVSGTLPISQPVQIDLPESVIAPSLKDDAQVMPLSRGQRISVQDMQDALIKVVYEHENSSPGLVVDAYIFLLQENGKVRKDEDLIFFGNLQSERGEIRVNETEGPPVAFIKLKDLPKNISRIVAAFSIYEDSGLDFSDVDNPSVRVICNGKDRYRFDLNDLSAEKTVVAVELYRYKGDWKLNAVGRGYQNGLAKLCESYGVNVE